MHSSATTHTAGDARLAGILAIAGSALMLCGAAVWASTGTDIDQALIAGEMSAYLQAAAEHRNTLITNLCFWIIGVLVLGAAGTVLSRVTSRRSALGDLARGTYWTAVPLALSAFLAWLALIVQGSANPDAVEVAIAKVVGWYAYRADGLATAMLIGIGPALLASAGRGDWVPSWLLNWGLLAGVAAVLSFVPYFVPAVPLGMTMIIVPVGVVWTIAAGVVLLRRRG